MKKRKKNNQKKKGEIKKEEMCPIVKKIKERKWKEEQERKGEKTD